MKSITIFVSKVQGYNLAADLVGVAKALETIRQAYQGNPGGLLREYGDRCEPKLSDRELQVLVRDAMRRRTASAVPIEKLASRAEWWLKQAA